MENSETIKSVDTRGQRVVKFLVFHIKDRKYAMYADQVSEIVIDLSLFPVPFVPPYVRGFINRHGEPYTVLDLNLLFEKEKVDATTYIILNIEDDQMALLISDVVEILKLPEQDLHPITATDQGDEYFLGSISSKGTEILVLNVRQAIARLEHDLAAS